MRVLDELVTDFVIETCHAAARSAAYSHRQKIKVDDFKFAIRGGEAMLGRVQELLAMQKELSAARRQFNVDEGKGGGDIGDLAGQAGVGEGERTKGKRGRRPKAALVVEEQR